VIVRPRLARTGVLAVVGLLAATLLAMAPFYGPHRDELYFSSAGDRLAWGYPDQPSLVALLARLSNEVDRHNLVLLRLPSLLAVCAVVVLAACFARLLGGDSRAQVLAAVTTATSAVIIAVGHRLTTQTFDILAWVALALVAGHALLDDRPRLWLAAGIVAGIGLNAKHDVAVCLFGLLVGIALTPGVRHHLRSPWLWVGGLVALVMWLPNLFWQAHHGWPVFALSADIRDEYGGIGGVIEYVLLTLVMFSPLMTAVWVAGLRGLLRRDEWRAVRPVAWMAVVTFVFYLVSGGKAYYLSGAIVPLLAAGCVVVAERFRRLVVVGAVLALSAFVAWASLVPVLPVHTYTASFYTAFDDDQLETIGWPEFAATVRTALAPLPDTAVVFTGNYGEAGALEWYGVQAPVYSGHNGWGDWGPPPDGAGPVVVLGYQNPSRAFTGCRKVATIPRVDGADNEEDGGPVFVCDAPREPWSRIWPRLVHLDA
jgi:hypothetical protein